MRLKFYSFLSLLFISIAFLQAQDYLISFAGSGAATIVETVKVENLTQGTSLTMNGNDVLHLMGTVTGIENVDGNTTGKIIFYPNPMNDFTKMKFALPEPSEAVISLYDISGRKIARKQDLLNKGQHIYEIRGIGEGIYFVRINSGRYSLNGKIISSGSKSSNIKIEYTGSEVRENILASEEKPVNSKGTTAETVMQYNNGDRLKLTGVADIHSTIITDVPTESKTITFNFIPCTDGEGNNYSVVKIGSQVWMAENLKTTKNNNGTEHIPEVTDNSEWANTRTPAYSWYNNDIGNKDVYGALYNWYAVDTGNICPVGWHVASDEDWSILTDYLGGASIAGGKLKSILTQPYASAGWAIPNSGATDEFGFSALPGGFRNLGDGSFSEINHQQSYWWTGTRVYASWSWYRLIAHSITGVVRHDYGMIGGFSVRCIKDN